MVGLRNNGFHISREQKCPPFEEEVSHIGVWMSYPLYFLRS